MTRFSWRLLLLLVLFVGAGCSGDDDADSSPSPSASADLDEDGHTSGDDCDDTNPKVYPGALEVCDGLDNDCNNSVDDVKDGDSDGYFACSATGGELDCDDTRADVYPGADELCDGADNNCDEAIDEGFDQDEDGYSSCASPVADCNDDDAAVNPAAAEVCNHSDDNCDGLIDNGDGASFQDNDADGFASCDGKLDCDDNDANVSPAGSEVCDNTKDENCDGLVGETTDVDGDGYNTCTTPFDCNDQDAAVHPGATEKCNGIDDNCSGRIDENFDGDADGSPTCSVNGAPADCDDKDATVYPGAIDVCDNGVDENCDTINGAAADGDGDGYSTCGAGPYDCDDSDGSSHPGATELCDARDNDCNGLYDDGLDAGDLTEPNNTTDAPYTGLKTINGETESVSAAITSPDDEDWFEFYSIDDANDVWKIVADLTDIPEGADYDMYLYQKDNYVIFGSSTKSGNADEHIDYEGTLLDDTHSYQIKVVWKSGGYGCPHYKLTIYAG